MGEKTLLTNFFSRIMLALLALSALTFTLEIPRIRIGSSLELPAAYPLVYVYPETVTADVGQTFTISVIVYNLTDATVTDPDNPSKTIPLGNLYGFDVQFTWDPTVLKYVNSTKPNPLMGGYQHPNVTVPIEKYPNPVPPSPFAGTLHGYGPGNMTLLEAMNVVNDTGNIPGTVNPQVRAWFAYTTMLPAKTFNGNGTMFKMTFKVLKSGASSLDIVSVSLADINGLPIGITCTGRWLNTPRDGTFRTLNPPVARFTHSPEVGRINELMHFDASTSENSSNILKYMWNFGDGVRVNTTVPIVDHNYTIGNTYTVSLKLIDIDGRQSGTTTHNVLIAGTPQISSVTITPTLRVDANVTCAGASNVSELMEYVRFSFKMEGTWFLMNMTYNSQTRLYTALIPAYNQLANKTIQYYVTARTKEGNILVSSIYTHQVPVWVKADINRDGKVNLFDIVLACGQYGKP
jgi:PKD repeat protein